MTIRFSPEISEVTKRFLKWKKVRGRNYHYLRKYNISLEEVHKLKKKQNYLCAICKKDFTTGKKTHLDHNHYTGKIRGVLCSNCNLGLGNFKDDIEFLKNAIKYLEEND